MTSPGWASARRALDPFSSPSSFFDPRLRAYLSQNASWRTKTSSLKKRKRLPDQCFRELTPGAGSAAGDADFVVQGLGSFPAQMHREVIRARPTSPAPRRAIRGSAVSFLGALANSAHVAKPHCGDPRERRCHPPRRECGSAYVPSSRHTGTASPSAFSHHNGEPGAYSRVAVPLDP
jgi:hypothetical protein